MRVRVFLISLLAAVVALGGFVLVHSSDSTTKSDRTTNAGVPITETASERDPSLVNVSSADPSFASSYRDDRVSDISEFREPLARYGRWTTVSQWGTVWIPEGVGLGWGPYENGYWAFTDAGWTWVSYDPWGWATCHYGRWYLDPVDGWVWVPGAEWAPAWVDWEFGDGFIGWGPLSPECVWGFDGFTSFVPTPVEFLRFVPERDFDDYHVNRFFVPVGDNDNIFHHARRVTDFGWSNGRVVDRSITRQRIEQAVGHHIRVRTIQRAASPGAARRINRNSIAMFRPNIRRANAMAARGANSASLRQQRRLERQQARLRRNRQPGIMGSRQMNARAQAGQRQHEHALAMQQQRAARVQARQQRAVSNAVGRQRMSRSMQAFPRAARSARAPMMNRSMRAARAPRAMPRFRQPVMRMQRMPQARSMNRPTPFVQRMPRMSFRQSRAPRMMNSRPMMASRGHGRGRV